MNIQQQVLNKFGNQAQHLKLIEEMAELTQALLKFKYRGLNIDLLAQEVKYEIADVKIMIAQMEMLFGSCLEEEKFKINRLRERIGV